MLLRIRPVVAGLTMTLCLAGTWADPAHGVDGDRARTYRCFGKDATMTYFGDGVVEGTPGDDVIYTGPEAQVKAGGGDDLVCGAQTADGGPGNDRIRYTGLAAPYDEDNPVSALLVGGDGNDRIFTRHYARISGGRGNDYIQFSLYAEVRGGMGDDWLDGEVSPDVAYMAGGAGNDYLRGGRNSDFLGGGPGTDVLVGGVGDDVMDGNADNDDLRGGLGTDTLYGGPGRDRLHGGRGTDRCYQSGTAARPAAGRAC